MHSENPTSKPPPGEHSADDVLPKVVAPSAGFILQLFLIPMFIVTIIVMVWMMFSWLAHMGGKPEDLVNGLKRGDEKSWRDAVMLGDLLRNPQHEQLKSDPQLARQLGEVLENQIAAGGFKDHHIQLRMYTCRALGEFETPVVLPALLKAVATQRQVEEIDVQRSAVEALAILIQNVGPASLRENDDLFNALQQASSEENSKDPEKSGELRSTAAFTFGVLGGERALNRLDQMQGDPYANTRYNAAVGLARYGDLRAEQTLLQMLDPDNEEAVKQEKSDTARDFKRALVITNGLRAVEQLLAKNPAADTSRIEIALEKLASHGPNTKVKLAAQEALSRLENRSS